MANTDKIRKDIEALEQKKDEFFANYPCGYEDISKKHGVSLQYIFKLRKKMDIKSYRKIN